MGNTPPVGPYSSPMPRVLSKVLTVHQEACLSRHTCSDTASAGVHTGVPLSEETPTPIRPPQVPRHRATVGSYGGAISYEPGTLVHGGRVDITTGLTLWDLAL